MQKYAMAAKTQTRLTHASEMLNRAMQAAFIFMIAALALAKPAPILIGAYSVVACWLGAKLLRKEFPVPVLEVNPFLLLIAATLALSIAFGGDWHEGARGLNKWLRGILIFWASYEFFLNPKNEKRAVITFSIIVTLAVINGIYQYGSGYDFVFRHPVGLVNEGIVRVTSSFGYFGIFASFLIMAIPVLFILIQWEQKHKLMIFLLVGLVILSLINLYLTRSRGAWIAFAGMVFLFCMSRRKLWLTILFCLALFAAAAMMPHDLIFHHKKESAMFDKTTSHRLVLWGQALNILKANPVLGCGLNTYVKNIEKYNEKDHYEARGYYAHNGYLQHAAETGFLGFAALILFFIRYFTLIVPNRFSKRDDSFRQLMVLLSVSGFLLYMAFDTIFHNLQPFLMLWIFLGWGLAISKRKAADA